MQERLHEACSRAEGASHSSREAQQANAALQAEVQCLTAQLQAKQQRLAEKEEVEAELADSQQQLLALKSSHKACIFLDLMLKFCTLKALWVQ